VTKCCDCTSGQVEGYLEEMLMLCQRSEEYNHFMLERMAAACAPKLLGANRENAFRSGQFNVVVRELIAYYINMVIAHSIAIVLVSALSGKLCISCNKSPHAINMGVDHAITGIPGIALLSAGLPPA
jgi:hypothetical protein